MSETSTIPMPNSNGHTTALSDIELRSVQRVYSMPMIASLISTLHSTFNTYTPQTYATAKSFSTCASNALSSAYTYTAPYTDPVVTSVVKPAVEKADSLANSSLDVLQNRFPSAFEKGPQDIKNFISGKRGETEKFVVDRSVRVGKALDQTSKPVVDVFESVVKKINSSASSPTANGDANAYQYQRALALGRDLSSGVYDLSAEQWKQLQEQSALVHATTEKVTALSHSASKFTTESRTRVISISNDCIAELNKLRASTSQLATSFSNSTSSQIQSFQHQTATLYKDFGKSLHDVTGELQGAIREENKSVTDKAHTIASIVTARVQPLLESMRTSLPVLRRSASQQNGDPAVH